MEFQRTNVEVAGQTVSFEISAPISSHARSESIASTLCKEDVHKSFHVIVMEKPPQLEPHYVDDVQRGWTIVGNPSYHVCRCKKGGWNMMPLLALALGFSPTNKVWDETELCAALGALLAKLDGRDDLSPTDVSDNMLVFKPGNSHPTRHDIEAVLDFNETTFGVHYREIRRNEYVRLFEEQNRLILGTTF